MKSRKFKCVGRHMLQSILCIVALVGLCVALQGCKIENQEDKKVQEAMRKK